MADFSNFELGDNVGLLANGLLPEMADAFEVELSPQPTTDELGVLVGALGAKKTLRDNESGAKAWLEQTTGSEQDALDMVAEWMDRSGVQRALDRSLWTPEFTTPDETPAVITGSVANWMDRVVTILDSQSQLSKGRNSKRLIIAAGGNREMNTKTEIVNANVLAFQESEGRLPTESQYLEAVVVPRLQALGHEVLVRAYDTNKGDEIAQRMVDDSLELRYVNNLAVIRVANAGIQLAVQIRKAIQQSGRAFDGNIQNPQMFVMTDTFEVARSVEECEDAASYQNPFTGIRQIALTGKLLVEAAVA
jgi:hypothetical protein